MKFKIGDVVQLLSGGPLMTVLECHPDPVPTVRCSWFAGDIRKKDNFCSATLKKQGPPPKPPK